MIDSILGITHAESHKMQQIAVTRRMRGKAQRTQRTCYANIAEQPCFFQILRCLRPRETRTKVF